VIGAVLSLTTTSPTSRWILSTSFGATKLLWSLSHQRQVGKCSHLTSQFFVSTRMSTVGPQMRKSGGMLQYASRISPGSLINAIFISDLIKIIEFFQRLVKRRSAAPTLSVDSNRQESGHLIGTHSILCKLITTRNESSSAA
jgi:hypothetical protein